MLARVEELLAGEPVAFIGVHAPKFTNERDPVMVREAVRRYGIRHPIAVDSDRRAWDEFAVSAWPTLVFIDPTGYVVGQAAGEPNVATLASTVEGLLREARARGVPLVAGPLPVAPESRLDTPLAYPSRVLARGDRLYVADAGHHRIVEYALGDGEARELRRFGCGEAGLTDGLAKSARFRRPNGMALDDVAQSLWVADSGNHAVRRVDLRSGLVTTVAGTGERSPRYPRLPGEARRTSLRSPWDLAWDAGRERLYVAMAGTHQIYALAPATGRLEVLAGTGREARTDGPMRRATFAQPSGLALSEDGRRLFVADAEISCVREVDLDAGRVKTLAGGDLFDFGDRDGIGDEARFQHPMDVAFAAGRVLVADAYNHEVRALDPVSGEVWTLFGNGAPKVDRDGRAGRLADAGPEASLLFEPEGLCADGATLYVADTNNHRVLAIGLDTGEVTVAVG